MPYRRSVVRDGKSVKVGSFVFRRRFKRIGEIRVQSGTNDHKTFKQYEAAIQDLYDTGQLEALIALKTRKCNLREIHTWWRDKTQTPPWRQESILEKQLFTELYEWIDAPRTTARLQDTTRAGYVKCIKMLESSCRNKDALLSELPSVLSAYRVVCETHKPPKARSFNQTRAALLSYVRQTQEKSSNLYQAIRNIDVISENPWQKRKVNNPLVPAEIDAAFKKNPSTELRDLVYFLCVTGMTPKEFLEDGWEIDEGINAVRIFGRKRSGRYSRLVPRVYQKLEVKSNWTYRQLLEEFKKVFPNRSLYDLRRTFAVWNNRSGIDVLHTKAYMGHGSNITERYMAQNIAGWLLEDATKLSAYIVSSRTEISDISEARLLLPDDPDQLTRNLQDEQLEYFRSLLDEQLKKWHRDGKMRRCYKVAKLILTDEFHQNKESPKTRKKK